MIRIEQLSFAYPGRKQLFEGLNLHLKPTDCVLLTGNNGSGKSTLLKLIVGCLKPQQGSIYLDGKHVQGLAANHFKHLYYHSQNTSDNLLGINPAQDWLIWQLALAGLPSKPQTSSSMADRLFTELSSGQARQVSQRILPYIMDRFWLLDEPFASLDSIASKALSSQLAAKAKTSPGMLIVAHEAPFDPFLFTRILHLDKGQITDISP